MSEKGENGMNVARSLIMPYFVGLKVRLNYGSLIQMHHFMQNVTEQESKILSVTIEKVRQEDNKTLDIMGFGDVVLRTTLGT